MLLFSSVTFILPFFFFWRGGVVQAWFQHSYFCGHLVPPLENLWSSALCQPNNPCFASSFGLNTAALCEVGSSVILGPGGAITLNYQGTTRQGESWTRDQTADHFFFKVVRTEDNGGQHISSTLNDLRKSPFKSRKAKCGCLLSRKGKRQQCDWQCGKEASCKKVETCLLGACS